MEESLNGKKFRGENPLSIRSIVHNFYKWQKEHPGEDLSNPEHASVILRAIRAFQKKGALREGELGVYGFDVKALEKGTLRASPVKNNEDKRF